MTARAPRLSSSNVRLYRTLRTAHLERAHQSTQAATLYVERRYDFDASLTEGLEVVRISPWLVPFVLGRSRVEVLEVNEPLMPATLRMTALAIAAVRLRGLASRRRTRIVSYAIGNVDPWSDVDRDRMRTRLRRWTERLLTTWVWNQIDRICFGTPVAQRTYDRALPERDRSTGLERRLILALPAPLEDLAPVEDDLVVFLGALTKRKGFDHVLAAWPIARAMHPGMSLLVLGKGPMEPDARRAAAADPSIDVLIDPPRRTIEEVLRRARVLTLPSQPTSTWREQVGLPIVEGLAAGCSIVTTTETGLASWLTEHGHSVIPPGASSEALASAIVEQVSKRRTPAEVTGPLPARDGRLAADAWLFERPRHDARPRSPGRAHG